MEQEAVFEQWNFALDYYSQSPQMRLTSLGAHICPTRRRPPQHSTANDVHQSDPSGPHVPGACSDYAACIGNPSGTADYFPGQQNPPVPPSNGIFRYYNVRMLLNTASVLDGLSNTLLFGEKHIPLERYGIAPDNSCYNGDHGGHMKQAGVGAPLAKGPKGTGQFGSYHPGICQFVLADGAVKALSVSIELNNLGRLARRDDGETITIQF
jgi:hypothetical protein